MRNKDEDKDGDKDEDKVVLLFCWGSVSSDTLFAAPVDSTQTVNPVMFDHVYEEVVNIQNSSRNIFWIIQISRAESFAIDSQKIRAEDFVFLAVETSDDLFLYTRGERMCVKVSFTPRHIDTISSSWKWWRRWWSFSFYTGREDVCQRVLGSKADTPVVSSSHSLFPDNLFPDDLFLDNLFPDDLLLDDLFLDNLLQDNLFLDNLFPENLFPDKLFLDNLFTNYL